MRNANASPARKAPSRAGRANLAAGIRGRARSSVAVRDVTGRWYAPLLRGRTNPKVPDRDGSARRDPRLADARGAFLVEILDRADHELDAEPVVDQVVARIRDPLGEGLVREQPDDCRGKGLGL